ncbi:MAG: DUF1579 domain-containing protein [Ignavibacteria bacterium]|nr:MAG: DUF1579 domain-containing protein [Ignavibacteria bacterium]
MNRIIKGMLFLCLLVIPNHLTAQTGNHKSTILPAEIMQKFIGQWEGTCKTWFMPGVLADSSKITGEFKWILNERFVRHTYDSKIKGQKRKGEETIIFNQAKEKWEVTWLDEFHMNYGILFSEGSGDGNEFMVFGNYATSPGKPDWGWETKYKFVDDNHLKIISYNVTPGGEKAKAIEVDYRRIR